MKINKTLIVIVLFCLLTSPALAASTSYFNKAQQYINNNCFKKKIADDTSLFCYLFDKTKELDQRITKLEKNPTITPSPAPTVIPSNTPTPVINNQKEIKVFDKNNSELGIYIDGDLEINVFIPSVQRQIHLVGDFESVGIGKSGQSLISMHIGNRQSVSYESTDCSGKAYGGLSQTSIIVVGPNKYFITNTQIPISQIHQRSYEFYNTNNNSFECRVDEVNPSWPVYQLQSITLPFNEPIATPLTLKY